MFELYQSKKSDAYYFRLKAANGETILSSQAYKAKAGCKKGIASVRANAADEQNYVLKDSSSGKQFFTLTAGNGQVIGTSQMYHSSSALKKGIAAVKKNAPGAEIQELG
jgi:uncharacterized protein YegP (UPF0339 family)